VSDFSLTLVPALANCPAPQQQADAVQHWLVINRVVSPVATACTLGPQLGYAPAAGALAVSTAPSLLPFDLAVNGLEIIIGRQVFDSGGLELTGLRCPACQENIVDKEWDLSPWANQESELLKCPQCNLATAIEAYTFEPAWGFSNLGFRFWNWPPFTAQFLEQVARIIGQRITVVQQRI
jgi:hypothetical protein